MTKKVFARVALIGAALTMLPDVAFACEQCFGAGNAETAQALALSMLSLLCMVGIVWGGIGMFVINVRKRTKQLEHGD